MLNIFLLFCGLVDVDAVFHLYDTDISNQNEYKDCLYADNSNMETNEFQLIPYCIRNLNINRPLTCSDVNFTFTLLKQMNVRGEDLYNWFAPIDIINDYQKYLFVDNSDVSLFADKYYCNCTVYDGNIDCEFGEDESYDCLTLEVNECDKKTEYRCQSGQCISRIFLIDFSYDCMDLSDEQDTYLDWFEANKSLNNPLYPFVKYLYHNVSTDSANHDDDVYKMWRFPNYICYNRSLCADLPYTSSLSIKGLTCIESKIPDSLTRFSEKVVQVFSSCSIARLQIDNNSLLQLFYCNNSMKFISKYRVNDQQEDCYYDNAEDEDLRHFSYTHDLPDRFNCASSNQSIPRPLMGHWRYGCADKSDTVFVSLCKKVSDLGCQFLRGTNFSPVYYVFQENCNGVTKLPFNVKNQTDETDCNEWPSLYRQRYQRCNGVWDTKNGSDEINCPNTSDTFLRQKIFNCSETQHYCLKLNETTISCLPIEQAGDGHIDCLGATDERTTSICLTETKFRCSDSICFSASSICGAVLPMVPTCHDRSIICPWNFNPKCWFVSTFSFMCKDNRCLDSFDRCNGIIDCSDGDDEWFCDLDYERKMIQFSFEVIDYYPIQQLTVAVTTDTGHQTAVLYQPLSTFLISHLHTTPKKKTMDDKLSHWYCNRSIIVNFKQYINTKRECLCPPSYYGERCQYQSRRLTIIFKLDIKDSLIRERQNFIKLVAYLITNETIVYYEEIIYMRMMKHFFYLIYPQQSTELKNWSIRLDAFSITTASNVDFTASWLFDIPFPFLPVNRLALYLILTEQETCYTLQCGTYGSCRKYLNAPYKDYCQCENGWSGQYCNISNTCLKSNCVRNGGKCLGRYPSDHMPICVCGLGRIGTECQVQVNLSSCKNQLCNNGGTCIALDQRSNNKHNYKCICKEEYYGNQCQFHSATVDIEFSSDLNQDRGSIPVMIVHFVALQNESPGILFLQNRFMYLQVPLNKNVHIVNNDIEYLPEFILVQVFLTPSNFDYYIAAIIKQRQLSSLSTIVIRSNRCPHINELIGNNKTILEFSLMTKVKYYHHACALNSTKCFVDKTHLCFCDKDRAPDCLVFQHESTDCSRNYCQNGGRCVQNNYNGIWNFGCVCQGCVYGNLCQLTTSQNAFSLNAMLGQDILKDVSLTNQPTLIKITLTVVILMITIGFVPNFLSLITFWQPKAREFGCGFYLFCLPIVGQCGLLIFGGRFYYLLATQLNVVKNLKAAYWSCISLEYFLSVCPALFDWLTACVAIERSVNIIKGILFEKKESVKWAKRVVGVLVILVCASSWHELFIRQLTDDPRSFTHTWCVVKFRWSRIEYYRLVVNLVNLIVPWCINLIATVVLLHKTARRKQTFMTSISGKGYFVTLKKQIVLYGSPLALITLVLTRLIFSFTLGCIEHEW
ncbi:unnamed protein product [Didymodactylos carnosus]|uniref:EGF-like domain-containing protein n=2 Tax=Didymodactylos carnosus TaxID=1234261 RepID=A0A814ZTT6_9BILA|nr:unnamed protein product [Didymodactylos carnosus]CAF4015371.1 unnamed protein product [Didymodactylos carnosus]